MKKRPILAIEQLETRETPDVSLGIGLSMQALAPAGDAAKIAPMLAPSVDGPQLAVDGPWNLPAFGALLYKTEDLVRHRTGLVSPETELEGWAFLTNYTRKAIRNQELRTGPLRDHEDILQQVFVQWREAVDSNGQALGQLLDRDSTERGVLRKTVRKVIDHWRYEEGKRHRMAELTDQTAEENAPEQAWRDLQLDLEQGIGELSQAERGLLDMRRQGMTFEEMGAELGLAKQRTFEMFQEAVERLQAAYEEN